MSFMHAQAHKQGKVTALGISGWGELWTGSSRGAIRVWPLARGNVNHNGEAGGSPGTHLRELRRSGGARPHGGEVKQIVFPTGGQVSGSVWGDESSQNSWKHGSRQCFLCIVVHGEVGLKGRRGRAGPRCSLVRMGVWKGGEHVGGICLYVHVQACVHGHACAVKRPSTCSGPCNCMPVGRHHAHGQFASST